MSLRNNVPFEYTNKQDFQNKLVEWVGDVLYDILPEHDYEVRDEQIFTAFQIADAICGKKAHLAEAGLGTGKTFAYLLSAVPYARMTGKPVVIACATPALQGQLAGETGDIQTLSKVLGLEIDARMAKDPHQYICDVRAHESMERFGELSSEAAEWIHTTQRGERSEIPTVSDAEWKKMKWEEAMNCDMCSSRGYCKVVKAREYYRVAKDLLIVDHETFFYDLWTRDERIARGQSPILPEYAAVIFDEGHKVLLPASMKAGKSIQEEEMESMLGDLGDLQGARDSLMTMTDMLEKANYTFFKQLRASVIQGEGEERLSIERKDNLLRTAATFRTLLDNLLLELQIEQELFTESLSPHQIQAYEAQIERAIAALAQFGREEGRHIISWMDQKDDSFWVVPRSIGALLTKHLWKKQLPTIFTSATLSNNGNFDYFMRTLSLNDPTKSTIGSPFDLENQVTVYLAESDNKVEALAQLLKDNGGRALVLTNSLGEMKRIKKALGDVAFPFEMIWEDQGERGYLVRKFRENETSVLVGANFWEGIDVPGESLTLLVVWELPLTIQDPLIEAQRKEAKAQGLDAKMTVDYPEMALKLKQGCGRLIRTEEDHGAIVVLDKVVNNPWESFVMGALPGGAKVYTNQLPKLD